MTIVHDSDSASSVKVEDRGRGERPQDYQVTLVSTRPLILALLSMAGTVDETEKWMLFSKLEEAVRNWTDCILSSGQVEKDLVDLCDAELVEVDDLWRCSVTATGRILGERLADVLLESGTAGDIIDVGDSVVNDQKGEGELVSR